jgi:hypothetical protein
VPDSDIAKIRDTVASLLGQTVDRFAQIAAGRNSRVYRAAVGNVSYAVKHYPPQSPEHSDRLEREFVALTFLRAHGVDRVPAPIARADAARLGIFEWIEGRPLDRDGRRVEDLVGFFAQLQTLRQEAREAEIAGGADCCFSAADVIDQLRRRRNRLRAIEQNYNPLARFLAQCFDPIAQSTLMSVRWIYKNNRVNLDKPLSRDLRCLSPSDFGFHNTVLGTDRRLMFVDLEYFGWDDPVKTVADVLLHPGMELSTPEQDLFLRLMTEHVSVRDGGFVARFERLFPLFGLIWCLIVLNDFLRMPATSPGALPAHRKTFTQSLDRQLAKAENMLDRVKGNHGADRAYAC